MNEHFQIDMLIKKLINLDTYVRELMRLDLSNMERIKQSYKIEINTSDGEYHEDDGYESSDQVRSGCEHLQCHQVACRLTETTLKSNFTIQQEKERGASVMEDEDG